MTTASTRLRTQSGIGAAILALFAASSAVADPIAIGVAGYWLENIGINTLGAALGGSETGTTRTLFVAQGVTPIAGTTATASLSGAPSHAPEYDPARDEWARGSPNPTAAQLGPLTVVFANGADTASFTGRSLVGVAPLALVTTLWIDSTVDPFGPTVHWSLPVSTGDYDLIQWVHHSNVANAEVGTRQTFADLTTASFDLYGAGTGGLLPAGFELTISVRLVDLYDDTKPLTTDNIAGTSRACINYTAPLVTAVPEPATCALMAARFGLVGIMARRRKQKA